MLKFFYNKVSYAEANNVFLYIFLCKKLKHLKFLSDYLDGILTFTSKDDLSVTDRR